MRTNKKCFGFISKSSQVAFYFCLNESKKNDQVYSGEAIQKNNQIVKKETQLLLFW